ncbi:hypothetical protein [Streptosporangium sp. CA-115845]|uniref:hypothetical protein n=1 Tax=Streptosporangium sp. CA-115845 TaxID=3240071 RepID=UPI003D8A969A
MLTPPDHRGFFLGPACGEVEPRQRGVPVKTGQGGEGGAELRIHAAHARVSG